jgi:urease accessory protein UreE
VGSEQWNNQVLEIWKKKSPSHTVGLEQYKQQLTNEFKTTSQSHMVGLKLRSAKQI